MAQSSSKPAVDSPQPVASAQAPTGPSVTAAEIVALRTKVQPCRFGASKTSPWVLIRVDVAPDRTPIKAEILDKARYNSDPAFRTAADAAHRAIMNPRCQPWPLSPERYNAWRIITFNFDPGDYYG